MILPNAHLAVSAWDELAEALREMARNTPLPSQAESVYGHMVEYTGYDQGTRANP